MQLTFWWDHSEGLQCSFVFLSNVHGSYWILRSRWTVRNNCTESKSFPEKADQSWNPGTSLVAQWLTIRLPMQGTGVQALVREDPTCRRATKPMRHNYWSPRATTTEACMPRACAPQREATAMRGPHTATKSSPRSLQLEKARTATKTQRSQK